MKSKRSRSTDISQKVKEIVWERDNKRCVICGSPYALPNAHYLPRSKGGLGIQQNILTLCNKCHYNYDFGDKEKRFDIRLQLMEYLKSKYPDWNEENIIYRKYNYEL